MSRHKGLNLLHKRKQLLGLAFVFSHVRDRFLEVDAFERHGGVRTVFHALNAAILFESVRVNL